MLRRVSLLAGLLLAGFSLSSSASAQLRLSAEQFFVGQAVTVTLPAAADTLRITYRPNSATSSTEQLVAEGTRTVTWTPREAGVVALAPSQGAPRNVSVQFQGLPVSGVVILLLAGLILFGGATFSARKLFEG